MHARCTCRAFIQDDIFADLAPAKQKEKKKVSKGSKKTKATAEKDDEADMFADTPPPAKVKVTKTKAKKTKEKKVAKKKKPTKAKSDDIFGDDDGTCDAGWLCSA